AAAATAAPPSDSAQAGTTGTEEPIEIDDDVPAGSKRGQRGPKLKSKVWKEFTRIKINGVWIARCDWCKKYSGGDTKNGTNHLRGHLDICPDRSSERARNAPFTSAGSGWQAANDRNQNRRR
ncbi:hypothetical protein BS78_08G159600, partial [Paspalum vaginatum]